MTSAPAAADQVARQLYGPEASRISQYVDILATRGVAFGLLGPKEASRIWDRHILNSAALSDGDRLYYDKLLLRGWLRQEFASGAQASRPSP